MKKIKKEKFEQIKIAAKALSNLKTGVREKKKEFEYEVQRLVRSNALPKEVDIKVGKEYEFIYYSNENLGTSKFPDNLKVLNLWKFKIEKETECYYINDFFKIKKDHILAILVD